MRAALVAECQDDRGNAIAGALVQVRDRVSLIAPPLYAASIGSTLIGSPVTGVNGQLVIWLDRGGYEWRTSVGAVSQPWQPFDAAPASDGGIDERWLDPAQVGDRSLVTPYDPRLVTTAAAQPANTLRATRVTVLKAGTLTDLSLLVASPSPAGNVLLAVYDTGDAVAGVRTLLWSTAVSLAGFGNQWAVLGSPGLVVKAGQALDLGVMVDSGATGVSVGVGAAVKGSGQLPAGFLSVPGGVSPRLNWQVSPGSFTAPASLDEATALAVINVAYPVLIARVH